MTPAVTAAAVFVVLATSPLLGHPAHWPARQRLRAIRHTADQPPRIRTRRAFPVRRLTVSGLVGLAVTALAGSGSGLAVAALAYVGQPRLARVRGIRRLAARRRADQPDVIDLFVALVRAGLSPIQATVWMAERGPSSWQDGFRAVDQARQLGERFADALDALAAEIGPPAMALVDVLTSADRYGHSLAASLERLSDEARTTRRQLGEAAARQLPVKLSFPLVCCTLPSFVLLTIAPLLGGAFSTLRLGGPP